MFLEPYLIFIVILLLGGTYNKESLAQAFVHFLEKESQPVASNEAMAASLLSLHKDDTAPLSTTSSKQPSHSRSSSVSSQHSSVLFPESVKEKPTVAVQPILLNEGILQQAFVPQRNSSAILKDILSDS